LRPKKIHENGVGIIVVASVLKPSRALQRVITRNLAIASRLRVSSAHAVTTVNFHCESFSPGGGRVSRGKKHVGQRVVSSFDMDVDLSSGQAFSPFGCDIFRGL